jgi:hypothetical protein
MAILSPKYLVQRLLIILPLSNLITALPGPVPAPALVPRADAFHRGWPLAEAGTCPSDTFRCGKAQCCPSDSWCAESTDLLSNICCPYDDDCAFFVALDSRCADTSWVLWTSNHDPICCLPGQLAVQPASTEYYGHCVPGTSKVPKKMLATKV